MAQVLISLSRTGATSGLYGSKSKRSAKFRSSTPYLDYAPSETEVTVHGFIRDPDDKGLGWVNWLTIVAPVEVTFDDFFEVNFEKEVGTCLTSQELRTRKLEDLESSFAVNRFYKALIDFTKKEHQEQVEQVKRDTEFFSARARILSDIRGN